MGRSGDKDLTHYDKKEREANRMGHRGSLWFTVKMKCEARFQSAWWAKPAAEEASQQQRRAAREHITSCYPLIASPTSAAYSRLT